MSKRAEEAALETYPVEMVPLNYQDLIDQFGGKTEIDVNTYPRCLFQQGYEQAEKYLGWHSVEESLPEMDEEVIVLMDEYGTAPIYKVGVGHIVDRRYAMDFNGWNTPGVKFWMPMPKIPEE